MNERESTSEATPKKHDYDKKVDGPITKRQLEWIEKYFPDRLAEARELGTRWSVRMLICYLKKKRDNDFAPRGKRWCKHRWSFLDAQESFTSLRQRRIWLCCTRCGRMKMKKITVQKVGSLGYSLRAY